jgi:uncharacterized protein (TIGR02271 family)
MIDTTNLPHLIGADVVGVDGDKIGTVGQVYVDPATNEPLWASVRTGLFGLSESFVPLRGATAEGDGVRVEYSKEIVKDAPRIDADGSLSEDEEAELYRYYDLETSNTGGDIGSADVTESTEARDVDFDAVRQAPTDATPGVDTADPTGDLIGAGTSTRADGPVGTDTSGPTTDDAMTRSEERLHVGTERVETGRVRLRKYVVTENETVTVPVTHEEVRLEREPITEENVGAATSGPAISEEEHEVVLTEERPVVEKEAVPVERVRLNTETVTEEAQVSEEVRKERVEVDDDSRATTDSDSRVSR